METTSSALDRIEALKGTWWYHTPERGTSGLVADVVPLLVAVARAAERYECAVRFEHGNATANPNELHSALAAVGRYVDEHLPEEQK